MYMEYLYISIILSKQQAARIIATARLCSERDYEKDVGRYLNYLTIAAFFASFLASSRLTMTAQAASPTILMVVRPISNRRSIP